VAGGRDWGDGAGGLDEAEPCRGARGGIWTSLATEPLLAPAFQKLERLDSPIKGRGASIMMAFCT
jgi:hypothetical protein